MDTSCLRFVDVAAWDAASPEWGRLLRQLPAHEQRHVTRFMFAADRTLALASRVLQRRLVHELFGVAGAAIDIGRTPENKPFWKRPPHSSAPALWNYNVSHHGTVVAIVSDARALVGVDVVRLTDRPRRQTSVGEFFRAFAAHFHASEWEYIRGAASTEDEDGQYARFYRLWSLKEAYIKAVGVGLGFSLLRAEFVRADARSEDRWELMLDGERASAWHFTCSQVNASHLVSVAYGPFSAMWKPETSSLFSPGQDIMRGRDIDDVEYPTRWEDWNLQDLLQ